MGIKRTLIKNSVFNLGAYVYLLAAAFFSIPIILRSLGTETFGLYILLASIVPLVSVLDLGLNNAVVRDLSLPDISKEKYIHTWKTGFTLYLLEGIIISSFIYLFLTLTPSHWSIFQHVDKTTLYHLTLIIPLTVLFNHINSHLLNLTQAQQKFEIFNFKSYFVGTGNTVITALASLLTHNLADLFLIQFVFHFITFVTLVIHAKKYLFGWDFFPGYEKKTARHLIQFGLKNFIGTFASQVEAQMSKYIIGASSPVAAITAFSIPQNIVQKGAGVISQIATVIFPTSTSLMTKERIPKLKQLIIIVESFTLIFGLFAIFCSFAFGEPFLLWWLKNEEVVKTAAPVLRILSVYLLLTSLTPLPSVIMIGQNHPQVPSFFAVFTTIIELVLLLILVPVYHAIGAATAILLASVISVPAFLLTFLYLLRRHDSSGKSKG